MVRGTADVRCALVAEQRQQRVEQPNHGADILAVPGSRRRPGRVEGPEQLVGGVDEV